jgi:hypothetical protein
MNFSRRTENYAVQNGTTRLTPRQQQRALKKLRREVKREQEAKR